MTEHRSSRGNQPITLQQKQTLIDAYRRTRNMTQAMREAGIRSPRTAYLWWHRFCEGEEAALQPRSHARKTQQRLSDAIGEEICQLRRQQPGWGRRQIANVLAQRYGRQVVSPASVEVVLRRFDLWESVPRPAAAPQPSGIPVWLAGEIDYARLLDLAQTGIDLSLRSAARDAAQVLQGVWRLLETDPARWHRLLSTPEIGSWLLFSRLHLGHSLMNSGNWPLAEHYLWETLAWILEHPVEPRQRAWEEEQPVASLRREEVRLGCYQQLGLVVGRRDVEAGLGYLQTARYEIQRHHQPPTPGQQARLGDLERDLAQLKLRLPRPPVEDIHQHLLRAQQSAEEVGSPGVQAFAYVAWAKLHDRLAREAGAREQGTRRQQRHLLEQAIERALYLVEGEQEDRPMRQTLCLGDAAQLFRAQGMPVEGQWVQRAAQYCLIYGYGGQAHHLLGIPGIHAWLPEAGLRNLSSLAQAG